MPCLHQAEPTSPQFQQERARRTQWDYVQRMLEQTQVPVIGLICPTKGPLIIVVAAMGYNEYQYQNCSNAMGYILKEDAGETRHGAVSAGCRHQCLSDICPVMSLAITWLASTTC